MNDPLFTARGTAIALACAVTVVAGTSAQTIQINGAGATFAYPIYSKWFAEYNKLHADIQINYQPHQLLGDAPLPESVVKLEMAALAQVKIS